jgi:hypothetical protein
VISITCRDIGVSFKSGVRGKTVSEADHLAPLRNPALPPSPEFVSDACYRELKICAYRTR